MSPLASDSSSEARAEVNKDYNRLDAKYEVHLSLYSEVIISTYIRIITQLIIFEQINKVKYSTIPEIEPKVFISIKEAAKKEVGELVGKIKKINNKPHQIINITIVI